MPIALWHEREVREMGCIIGAPRHDCKLLALLGCLDRSRKAFGWGRNSTSRQALRSSIRSSPPPRRARGGRYRDVRGRNSEPPGGGARPDVPLHGPLQLGIPDMRPLRRTNTGQAPSIGAAYNARPGASSQFPYPLGWASSTIGCSRRPTPRTSTSSRSPSLR